MGAVHLGTMVSPAGERTVALKRIHDGGGQDTPGSPAQPERLVAEPEVDRLVAEAQLVFRLTHANICQVFDLARSEDGTFMVMEFVDGLDLRTLLRRLGPGTPLDLGSAIYIAREIARALDYAHRRTDAHGRALWLVHGDVKPQNVLLSREGEVKLADFGIARAFGTSAPGNDLVAGTPGYMAPEAVAGLGDHRTDVYSLGITLAVALGGDPRGGIDLADLARRNPEITPELIAILRTATATRQADRYPSAGALEQALSLPFSRIDPPFSPSTLGRLVAMHAGPSQQLPQVEPGAGATLCSIASWDPTRPDAPREIHRPQPSPPIIANRTRPLAPRSRPLARWLALGVALVVAVAGAWFLGSRSEPTTTARAATARPHEPLRREHSADLAVDAAPPVTPPAAPPAIRSPVARKRNRVAPPDRSEPGFLTVTARPWGEVFVDGKRVARQTPAYRVPTAPGPRRVHVFNPESKARSPVKTVQVRSGKTTTLGIDWSK